MIIGILEFFDGAGVAFEALLLVDFEGAVAFDGDAADAPALFDLAISAGKSLQNSAIPTFILGLL
jgi:hypothetical protein